MVSKGLYSVMLWLLYLVSQVRQGRTSITRSACQANILQLSCPQHSHIRITQDFYGQSAQCVYSAGDCVYDFTDFHQCSGLQACNVTVQQVHNPYCPETDISYYQVIYTCIPDAEITDICTKTSISDHTGYLTSPQYPINYPIKTDPCRTVLTVPRGQQLYIYILDFDIPHDERGNCRDQLTIYGGENYGNLKRFCRSSKLKRGQLIYSSNASTVSIEFSTGYGSGKHKGFWLKFEVREYTGEYRGPLSTTTPILPLGHRPYNITGTSRQTGTNMNQSVLEEFDFSDYFTGNGSSSSSSASPLVNTTQQMQASNQSVVVASLTTVILVLMMLMILVLLILLWRRKKQQGKENEIQADCESAHPQSEEIYENLDYFNQLDEIMRKRKEMAAQNGAHPENNGQDAHYAASELSHDNNNVSPGKTDRKPATGPKLHRSRNGSISSMTSTATSEASFASSAAKERMRVAVFPEMILESQDGRLPRSTSSSTELAVSSSSSAYGSNDNTSSGNSSGEIAMHPKNTKDGKRLPHRKPALAPKPFNKTNDKKPTKSGNTMNNMYKRSLSYDDVLVGRPSKYSDMTDSGRKRLNSAGDNVEDMDAIYDDVVLPTKTETYDDPWDSGRISDIITNENSSAPDWCPDPPPEIPGDQSDSTFYDDPYLIPQAPSEQANADTETTEGESVYANIDYGEDTIYDDPYIESAARQSLQEYYRNMSSNPGQVEGNVKEKNLSRASTNSDQVIMINNELYDGPLVV